MNRIVVLTGGVGGAKLVVGLARTVDPGTITAIVNTGDDFEHLGLAISPDIDTLLYALSGRGDAERGWGSAGESWQFMDALASLGGPDWFSLGDRDLALHVLRTRALRQGIPLSQVVAGFARQWGIGATILPMTEDRVATQLDTDRGLLDFQNYFVEARCEPVVKSVRFSGATRARPAPGVVEAIGAAELILIAPSNPYLSIDPILSIRAIRHALREAAAPIVCICPIVGGQAVKGPTAKMMAELGLPVSPTTIAAHYDGLIDALLVDERDRDAKFRHRFAHRFADTLMHSLDDRARVAAAAIALGAEVRA